jgi:methylmalonyl-CoA mutase N-terminal domain/subunit
MEFFTAITHEGFFEEIAKIRALKKVYAKLMKERFKAKDPRSFALKQYILAPTGPTMYREQPFNNVFRIALAGLAAALTGAERILCRTWTEGLGIPTEDVTLLSMRAQQIIAYETRIGDTVDPLAGSYFLETLTCEYEEKSGKRSLILKPAEGWQN